MPQRGEKHAVVQHAEINAREALERRLAESAGQAKLLEGVAQLFGLPAPPERIEVYDNCHIMGANPYGVMIVAGPEGFRKAAYRKFAIRGPVTPGDDFAMMREVLQRRFTRALKEQAEGAPATDWPDVVLIDGGAGQLSAAREVLTGSRRARREAGGDRQGPRSRCRARMVPHRRRGAVPTAAARSGAVFPAAPARRGAPLRHHHAPRGPVEEHPAERTGRNPRDRRGPQARAAEPFRFGARREDGGACGSGGGARASATRPRGASTRISIRGYGWRLLRSCVPDPGSTANASRTTSAQLHAKSRRLCRTDSRYPGL